MNIEKFSSKQLIDMGILFYKIKDRRSALASKKRSDKHYRQALKRGSI